MLITELGRAVEWPLDRPTLQRSACQIAGHGAEPRPPAAAVLAPYSGGLRNLRDRLPVQRQLARDPFVGVAVDDTQLVDDQRRVEQDAPELLVVAQSPELVRGPLQLHVAGQAAAVRIEQDHLERLDPALL